MGFDALIPFCAGAAIGAGAIYYFTKQEKRVKYIEDANGFAAEVQMEPLLNKSAAAAAENESPLADFEKDDVLAEQLTRNVQFFGMEGQKKIANAFVVVVGLGVRKKIKIKN